MKMVLTNRWLIAVLYVLLAGLAVYVKAQEVRSTAHLKLVAQNQSTQISDLQTKLTDQESEIATLKTALADQLKISAAMKRLKELK